MLVVTAGCTAVAEITTLSDSSCSNVVIDQLRSILVDQDEHQEIADRLAGETVSMLSAGSIGPRPFVVSSPSGVDYGLFIQRKSPACLLRLYARQKGFTRYTNNLAYIATRPLPGCSCSE